MKLWREREGYSLRALARTMAERNGGVQLVNASGLSRIEGFRQRASEALMVTLFELSGGELRPDHFVLPGHLHGAADARADAA